jgi:hypothetical protein
MLFKELNKLLIYSISGYRRRTRACGRVRLDSTCVLNPTFEPPTLSWVDAGHLSDSSAIEIGLEERFDVLAVLLGEPCGYRGRWKALGRHI